MKWTKIITGLILIFISLGFATYIKWANADMTDTRLLIEYWKEYLCILVICFSGYFLVKSESKKEIK
jgi:hypothetical protein